jgi:uncharacterized protein
VARALPSVAVLAAIGLAGGFFGALFGVGGGIIVVPLLIVAAGFDPREAAGTSLAVIGFTAVFGMLTFAALGEVHWRDAALVGAPAAFGTFFGTWLQQRISSRTLVLVFAGFIVAVAIRLLLE